MKIPNWKDYQLHLDYRIANIYGIEEAIVINKLQALIASNKTAGRNYFQGRTWTFNSYEEWVNENVDSGKRFFPCFSKEQIRRVFDSLAAQKVLIKGNFNKRKNDKTNWYAFLEEEIWIDAKSPISNYGSDRLDGITLPESAEQKDLPLFENETFPESAEQKDVSNNSVPALPKSTDQINQSAGIGNETVENDRTISQERQNDLPESANHYQLSPSKSNEVAEEKDAAVNPFDLLINKTPLTAYYDGTADKLAFDFNDLDLVRKKIEQLFRIFVRDAQPHFAHVDAIRDALLNDMRPELSRKVCWVIIQKAFMEYPGTEKKYKTENALITRIGWKKNDFVQDLHTHNQNIENAKSRSKEREKKKVDNQEAIDQILVDAKEKLERYKHKLNIRQIEEIAVLIKNRNYLQAQSKLIEYVEDNEAAA